MSRLIVKNLPKKVTEARIREVFGQIGAITDCNLKFKNDGTFRGFAFIGYATEGEAQNAVNSLNNTYINSSKINVEIATDLSKSEKPPTKVSAEKKIVKLNKQKKEHASDKILANLSADAEFQEFLAVHKSGNGKMAWSNDDGNLKNIINKKQETPKSKEKMLEFAFEGESDSSDDEAQAIEAKDEEDEEVTIEPGSEIAKNKTLSDMEYLKKKSAKTAHLSDDEDEIDVPQEEEDSKPEYLSKEATEEKESYVAKLKNLPINVNRTMVQGFLQGITIKALDLPRNDKKKPVGVAFVHFKNKSDLEAALRRSRSMMGNKKVTVIHAQKREQEPPDVKEQQQEKPRPWQLKTPSEDSEPIADTGRLFVRNLAHICTEEDVEQLFKQFGQLTEVSIPIDSLSKRMKGYAHITYMFPEHALQAYNKLDGTNFKGRLLHILPGIPKKEQESDAVDDKYKKKQKANQKKLAQSSHNWNTLFLGANAVANVMAAKYGVEKSQLLDSNINQSLAVRMALGETEIVNETRDFLISNGVSLNSFSQAVGPRSKTVILVKNLPSETKREELVDLFKTFGSLGKVILPPSGITAIVEFQEPHEAKQAFTKLAYTRFKHIPLYLEWAPQQVFNKSSSETKDGESKEGEGQPAAKDVQHSTEESETEGCVLFVKNLNFETTEDKLKQHFLSCGTVVVATVAQKRNPKNPKNVLSMGYGFVQYQAASMAQRALKELQHSTLDNHSLEIKLSERTVKQPKTVERKKVNGNKKQNGTKILVRNIPFQANKKELSELFKVFGEVKTLRLPKKVGDSHRGFAFVDFLSKEDAKRAFEALCHSTHLYGRRLVLEWADAAEESVTNLRRKTADGYITEKSAKVLKRSEIQTALESSEVDNE